MLTPGAQRLPHLARIADQIDTIVIGRSAEQLHSVTPSVTSGVLLVLPTWVWLPPIIDVGMKGASAGVMPIRVAWEPGPVVALGAGQPATVRWRLSSLGHNASGTLETTAADSDCVRLLAEGVNRTPYEAPAQLTHLLRQLIRQGTEARWALLLGFESFVRSTLEKANAAVAAEITQHSGAIAERVLDDISLDDLATKMLWGEAGSSSAVSRMIEQSVLPDKFRNVDPVHYFAVAIRARAEEAIRQKIGDPKVGPKVRRLFARGDITTLDELIAEYRRLYPRDSLAKKRALKALTAGAELSTRQLLLEEHYLPGQGMRAAIRRAVDK